MDLLIQDESREFSIHDANELLCIVCNKEDLLEKKRRWLQLSAYVSCGSKMVQRKRRKFLAEKFVPESYIRNEEVSCDNVRTSVDKSFRFFCNNQSKHHVINSFFDPFNAHGMEDKEIISSITRDLTNTALYSIACIVTRNNLKLKKTRPELMKVVEDNLTDYLSGASGEPDELFSLSEVFKNPSSYLHGDLKTVIPVTKHLLLSIYETLERLDELTLQELIVIFRKLRGIKVKEVPQFPPVISSACSKQTLVERVKRQCNKYLSNLQEGQEIPKQLAIGLTVVVLSLYYRLDHPNVSIREFSPFPEEVVCTQMEILHALRSLRKLRKEELELLIPIIDPTDTVPRSSFKSALKNYMVECLFVCDEIRVPKKVLRVIDLINKSPQAEPNLFSKENREKEIEAVLNVSCYLKSVVANLLSERVIEGSDDAEEVASEGNDEGRKNWCYENNDFEFSGTDFFFNSVGEGLGKGLEKTSSNWISTSVNSSKGSSSSTDSHETPTNSLEKQDGGSQACSSKTESEIEMNENCDETALVAHKLIGQLINGFLKFDKTETDESTISYLTDGCTSNNNHGGANATQEETNVLFDAVETVLPSFPKSFLTKVKRLMEF